MRSRAIRITLTAISALMLSSALAAGYLPPATDEVAALAPAPTEGFPWSTPRPTATPTSTPTPTPLPPADPSSRLPRLILDVSLGLPGGDAYEPTSLLLDSRVDRLHVFSSRFEGEGQQGAAPGRAISVLDLTGERLFHNFALPIPQARPLIATGEWIYLCHPDSGNTYKLSALGSSSRQVAATISLPGATGCDDLDLKPDFGGERIYLAFADRLEVRTPATLQLLKQTVFAEPRPALKIAVHPSGYWVYLYTADSLEVRRTGDLGKPAATIPLEEPLKPQDLILGVTEQRSYLSPADLVATATAVASGGGVEAGRLYLHQGERVEIRNAESLGLISTISDERLAQAEELAFDSSVGQIYARAGGELLTIRVGEGSVSSAKAGDEGTWRLLDANGPTGTVYLLYEQPGSRAIKAVKAATGKAVAGFNLDAGDMVAPDVKRNRIYVVCPEKNVVLYLDSRYLTTRKKVALGVEITGLVSDPSAGRVYLTDNAGRVRVLDSSNGDLLATFTGEGKLYLDTRNKRLYLSEQGSARTYVIDTEKLAQLDSLRVGGAIALDPQRNRIYIGKATATSAATNVKGVLVYSGKTMKQIGLIPKEGRPAFNPLTNEVYVVSQAVYVASGETWKVTGELKAQPGISNVTVYPTPGLIALEHSGGITPTVYLDARTRETLSPDFTQLRDCGSVPQLADPVGGRTYGLLSGAAGRNLVVYGAGGKPLDYLDGVGGALLDPAGGLAYLPYSYSTVLLDLEKLAPIGQLPYNFRCGDFAAGLLYSTDEHHLRAFERKGGSRITPALPEPSDLSAQEIAQTYQSPDYQADHTAFALVNEGQKPGLYRSTDDGASWQRLTGGLPELPTALFISPDYSRDDTVFATFDGGGSVGAGIYRSTDGGLSWQPVWSGLKHLRVYRLELSAGERPALAYARYADLAGVGAAQGNRSTFQSDDGGESWSQLLQGSGG